MKVPEPENEQPLAWTAILADTPVHAVDGQQVGTVREVLGAEAGDIFHGIVVHTGLVSHDVMIAADQVTRISNRRVDTSLSSEMVRELPPYREEESYQLGFVGFIRKHLGWVREKDNNPPG